MRTITRDACAKINLMLAVDRARGDGMHPIASWMCLIELCDVVALERRPEGRASLYAIDWHDEAMRKSEIDWAVTDDLAVRAHRALEDEVDGELPVRMRVLKRIPVGAGLGGGSSDAAAVLTMTRELFGLDVDDARLEQLAHGLGTDVPFFVNMIHVGARSALVMKLGEDIEVTEAPNVSGGEGLHVLLMVPGCVCETGAVYHAFDAAMDYGHVFRDVEVARAARAGVVEMGDLFNDLEAPACSVAEELEVARAEVEGVLGEGMVRVTGSGSGMFAVFGSRAEAMEASQKVRGCGSVEARVVVGVFERAS